MHFKSAVRLFVVSASWLTSTHLHGAISVAAGHHAADVGFEFGPVHPPASNDAATRAELTLADGRKDAGSADLSVLTDGKIPGNDDDPRSNFFFAQGTGGGRIVADLMEITPVKAVASYSWHRGSRGPQVYKLYAASGKEKDFDPSPKRPINPKDCGWTPVAVVDTRNRQDAGGGQHGVEITNQGGGSLGDYRYLLFDIEPTSKTDVFGNTFFSEIDVISGKGPAPERFKAPEKIVKEYRSKDGKLTFIIDSTHAPELTGWSEKELLPVIQEWYPKLVALLPSNGYRAADVVTFEYKPDINVPAYALANKITMNATWFPGELKREAKGCVVHEMGHVVQNYWRAQMTNRNPKPTPGWVTEGICDYIRWFLYEPGSKGAGIAPGRADSVNYDQSYRTTGNFLDWVITERDKKLLEKLNAVAREGTYDENLWKEWTGKTLPQLDAEWKDAIRKGRRVQD